MLQVTEVAHSELEYISEREKLEVISGLVRACDFDPEEGVYTGIEGEPFDETGILPILHQTYGLSHEEYCEHVEQEELYGSSRYGDSPLYYALAADIDMPAMVVYDLALLERSEKTDLLWLPKNKDNIQDAVRVVIKIAID